MINIQHIYTLLTNYKYRYLSFLLLSTAIIVADQTTKYAIASYLQYGESIEITSFFSIIVTYNSGAAFSMLSDAGGWQRIFLSSVSIIAVVFILAWMLIDIQNKRTIWGLSFILGGASGNLIDRVNTGQVTDFILFGYNNWYFPAFNIADTFISLGAVILIINLYFQNNNLTK